MNAVSTRAPGKGRRCSSDSLQARTDALLMPFWWNGTHGRAGGEGPGGAPVRAVCCPCYFSSGEQPRERCWPEQRDDGAIYGRILDPEELRACVQISICPCELSRQIALLKTNLIIISSLHKAPRIKPKLLPLAVKALCDLARGPR